MKNISVLYGKRWVNLIPNKQHFYFLCAWMVIFLSGCARAPIPEPSAREQSATQIARNAGWQFSTIDTSHFVLATYLPKKIEKTKTLTVYIEGDGFAWKTPTVVSDNPTPIDPVALKLALVHPARYGAAAYIARPCQYVAGLQWKNCAQLYWTSHRFSADVVDAENQAIEELKQRFGAYELILVGYSGGGAVATLVAARRNDVVRLITVAGNLDTDFWVKQNRFKPLTGSLNPADQWQKLVGLPQTHFAGEDDEIVKPDVAYAYAKHFPVNQQPIVKVIPEFTHSCCWARDWQTLFK